MSPSDTVAVREWSHALVKTLDPVLSPEELQAAGEAARAMDAYLLEVIADKRRRPAGDLLTALITAEEDGDVLGDEELVAQVALLFVAGHETTVNLIGNGTLALLRNRGELERLRDDPSLGPNAIEELLRYDSPVQFTRRVMIEDVEIGGERVPAGSFVAGALGSANRDPRQFDDPDRLDLGRENAAKHVSFGGGIHYCLGAALARIEGQAAIGGLVRRFPGIELATDTLEWNGRINLRGLASLPVALAP
jgi:cytochrome P450